MKRANRTSDPSPSPLAPRRPYVPRKTMYELPPLELECMKALWQRGEASVREIRERLAAEARPLAYTTVETIMDRLMRKGVVERRKVGKAHRYTPVYQKAEARVQAVATLVEHFFDGSRQSLLAHLQGAATSEPQRLGRPLTGPAPRSVSAPAARPAASRPAITPKRREDDTSLL